MNDSDDTSSQELAEHFFRTEYGKIVSVVTRHLGVNNVETAEDIVQETLLKATDHWQQHGIPPNPEGWLYTTARNLTLNIIRRKKHRTDFENHTLNFGEESEVLEFSEETIKDEQLRMMFACCHPSISEDTQITLMLKILCGFSIAEIASAFFTASETINKRLVRGRKQLRQSNVSFDQSGEINELLEVVQKTIYLLFNEGYFPNQQNDLFRFDLCLEAIRLTTLLVSDDRIKKKTDSYSLLSLMYLNASRFEARTSVDGSIVEMSKQDRSKWNKGLIDRGIHYLDLATEGGDVSKYLILAAISAQHCLAPAFEKTNWVEILSLYDNLLVLEDSATTRLNRSVALARVEGNAIAIEELIYVSSKSDLGNQHLYHTTLAELYKEEKNRSKAEEHLNMALKLCTNDRDRKLIEKKLKQAVPIS
ncbi:MAG: sigma-70 family RNA polymerase sigma factor [Cyclobacteriaceae bacterium]